MNLADRIRLLRGTLSQADFGVAIGISQPSVKYYEKGERVPDANTISNICTHFQVSSDWLLFGVGDKDQNVRQSGKNIRGIDEQKTQHIKFIGSDKNKMSDAVGHFPQSLYEEIRVLEKELRMVLSENADLRVERERMLGQMAALEKEIARLKEVSPRPFTTAATAVVGASAPGPVSEADMSNTAKTTPAPMPDEQPRSR